MKKFWSKTSKWRTYDEVRPNQEGDAQAQWLKCVSLRRSEFLHIRLQCVHTESNVFCDTLSHLEKCDPSRGVRALVENDIEHNLHQTYLFQWRAIHPQVWSASQRGIDDLDQIWKKWSSSSYKEQTQLSTVNKPYFSKNAWT